MINRRAVLAGSGTLAGIALIPRALADSKYPERPIRVIVPAGAGAVSDVVVRPWAAKIKDLLGVVVIEYQGGSGGTIAATAVAHSNPDGYTILVGTMSTHVHMAMTLPYDPVRDFAPISILVVTAMCVVTNPSLPARTLRELIDYARSNPDKLTYGSGGIGSVGNLAGELFKSLTGTADIVHVPYKSIGHALSDVVSGNIPLTMMSVTPQVLELHRSGQVRMLAVAAPARLVAAPDIPTAEEAGLPGMIAHNFMGLFAPTGTPTTIVDRLSQATRTAMADDEFRKRLMVSGFEPYPDSSPEAARRFVGDEIAHWAPIIKRLNLGMPSGDSART
jgi:tripartite-type tricarboxylate transporter receptor subunit TctC